MKKLIASFAVMFAAFSLFAGIASAHVTVLPKETTQGSYEMFTLRVPSENETVPTTQVKVEFPKEVNISRFEPKPGWKYEIEKDASGKITSVIWTAENEGLSSTEFGLFYLQGKVADDATEIAFKAYQTYQDGSVVEWIGAPDSEKPASVTTVKPADGSDDHHHGTTETKVETKTEQTNEETVKETTSSSNAPLYVSIAALIAALVSVGISLKRRG
ncbi:YcnI family protein [Neobacillus niacini]|uniref:YcnI family copper-binding membrane protein n=1 Tax=Neobacillus niacini TaxID=86668 RepID=UPI00052F5A6D|nr:YcnI family protein [Neobacillus niacini]KGM44806.1 nuclear export factor GLE1 [Neobacillus niacini]MEC1522595.1 YcnI family protein [Neobacillus niacini]